MRSRGIALAAAFLLVTGAPAAAQSSQQPFSFEDVDFTSDCSPNSAFVRLLTVLRPGAPDDAADAVPIIDEPLHDAVSGAVLHVLQLRQVPWHGLRLVGVRFYQGIESGPSNLSLAFADSPERVREVWNQRGWNLPPVGETRVIEDDVIVTAVGVGSDGQHAAVTCFVD